MSEGKITDGIQIPRDVAEAEGVPEELDSSVLGPYRFPDPQRRRLAGMFYIVAAVIAAVTAVVADTALVVAVICAVLAVWHFASAWSLGIDQEEALTKASRVMPFAIGHASAAIAFTGIRSRPRWQVIAYSADDPPSQRALAEFDAVHGDQLGEVYVEAVPSAGVGTSQQAADVATEKGERSI